MSEHLEDQIRRQTETMYDQAPPIGSLMPDGMTQHLDIADAERNREAIGLTPFPTRTRFRRWPTLAGVAALALLLFLPLGIWLAQPEDAVGGAALRIVGEGTLGPISSGETISFTLDASKSGDTASGQLVIQTIEPGLHGHWRVEGDVVCIEPLNIAGSQFFEVRYQMTRSNFPVNPPDQEPDPSGLPGAYASFFVMDSQNGDWAGEVTGTGDFSEQACGAPRSAIPVFPITSGSVNVHD